MYAVTFHQLLSVICGKKNAYDAARICMFSKTHIRFHVGTFQQKSAAC